MTHYIIWKSDLGRKLFINPIRNYETLYLIRASNTQPVLVLRFEAKAEERLGEIINIFTDKLSEYASVKFSEEDFRI